MIRWLEKIFRPADQPNDLPLHAPHDYAPNQISYSETTARILAGIREEFENELNESYEKHEDTPYEYVTDRLKRFDDEICIGLFVREGTNGQNTISATTSDGGNVKGFPCFQVFGKTHSEGGERTPSYAIMAFVEKATRRYIAKIAENHFDAGTSDDEVHASDYGVSVTLEILGSSSQIVFSTVGAMDTIQDLSRDALRRHHLTSASFEHDL